MEPPWVGGSHLSAVRIKNAAFTFRLARTSSTCRWPSYVSLIVLLYRLCCVAIVISAASLTRSITKDSQWRTIMSTTTLKMVGDSGSPCVTPLSTGKRSPQYPPAHATI